MASLLWYRRLITTAKMLFPMPTWEQLLWSYLNNRLGITVMTFMILYVMILWHGWISWGTEHSPCGVSTTLQLVSCLTGFAIRPDKEICSYLCAVKLLCPYRSSWKQAVKLNFSPQWVLSGHCCQCNRFKVTYYQISSEFSPQWKKKNPVKCNIAQKTVASPSQTVSHLVLYIPNVIR